MAGTTSAYGFPYPTGTDSINTGDTKIQELAQAIEDFIDGSEASGKLFNFNSNEDVNNRTTINCSSTPKNVASSTAGFNFTLGASGLFAVIVSGNANNTTTAANGWALGASVSGGGISADVELSSDPAGTSRAGGSSFRVFDGTGGATVTLTPRVRTILTGGADSIIVYQHRIQVISLG
jgi:hypothetical protein